MDAARAAAVDLTGKWRFSDGSFVDVTQVGGVGDVHVDRRRLHGQRFAERQLQRIRSAGPSNPE